MHNVLSRVNVIFAHALSCLFVTTTLLFFSTFTFETNATSSVDVTRILLQNNGKLRNNRLVDEDVDWCLMEMSLNIDPRKMYHWNVKMIFLYLVVEYSTDTHSVNQLILWDYIMLRKDKRRLIKENEPLKYPLVDDGAELRGRDLKFTVRANIIPNAGHLPNEQIGRDYFYKLPKNYTQTKRGY
ncbi:hypothetical protein SNEBB_002163 [Seison nebaliae]|nr:hypothetical protein SNEBB_002163 [Seison nebaliae]